MADSGFEIEMLPNGKVDIVRDRRAFWYDLDDVDEAIGMIRSQHGRGLRVTIIEPDGYRRQVTT